MQIKIFTKEYIPLTTLFVSKTESDFNGLRYRDSLHQVGDASFVMRLDNPKTNEINTRHYNIVQICEENGTPRWSGVIVMKKVLLNTVTISCYSLMYLLTRRLINNTYTGISAGAISLDLLTQTNSIEDTKIIAGILDNLANVEVTFENSSIFDALKRLAEASGGQFKINADRSLDMRSIIGNDLSNSLIFQYRLGLIAAANILSFQVDDDGKQITTETTGESGGLFSTQTDATLKSNYGLLQEYKNFRELDDQMTLDNTSVANNKGSELSPFLTLSPKVADNFEVGDIVKVILENRLVNINDNYQITEKTVTIKDGGQREIAVRIISNTSDFFKQIRDMKRDIDLLQRTT